MIVDNQCKTIKVGKPTNFPLKFMEVKVMLFVNYDSKKVQKVLESVEPNERKAFYEGMGVTIDNCTSLESALKLSGLDFEVEKKPLYFADVMENGYPNFIEIKDQFSTVRSDTKQSLGVVGKDYNILQNREAFDFLDDICAQGAKFETAGFFKKNGAASYITMSTEPISILDDEWDNYMLFANGFDGESSVRVCLTNVRAVCRNSAILAIKKASNLVSIKHSKVMYSRLEAAKEIMLANSNYLNALKEEAEKMAVTPFSEEAFNALINKLFPVKAEDSELVQIRNLALVEQLLKAYKQDDLQNFNGTMYKAFQAFSDFESHKPVFRKTTKVSNNGTPEFQVVMAGMPLLNKAYQMMLETA